jgi:hypothetical protein
MDKSYSSSSASIAAKRYMKAYDEYLFHIIKLVWAAAPEEKNMKIKPDQRMQNNFLAATIDYIREKTKEISNTVIMEGFKTLFNDKKESVDNEESEAEIEKSPTRRKKNKKSKSAATNSRQSTIGFPSKCEAVQGRKQKKSENHNGNMSTSRRGKLSEATQKANKASNGNKRKKLTNKLAHPMTAYNIFGKITAPAATAEGKRKKKSKQSQDEAKASFAEHSRAQSEQWKKLSLEEKGYWNELARLNTTLHYIKQEQKFAEEDAAHWKAILEDKKKKSKARTAFQIFADEKIRTAIEKLGEEAVKTGEIGDFYNKLRGDWNGLSADQQENYRANSRSELSQYKIGLKDFSWSQRKQLTTANLAFSSSQAALDLTLSDSEMPAHSQEEEEEGSDTETENKSGSEDETSSTELSSASSGSEELFTSEQNNKSATEIQTLLHCDSKEVEMDNSSSISSPCEIAPPTSTGSAAEGSAVIASQINFDMPGVMFETQEKVAVNINNREDK